MLAAGDSPGEDGAGVARPTRLRGVPLPPSLWAAVARACAERAYSLRAECSRGVLLAGGKLVVFDNLPPGGSMLRHERQAGRFARRLDADGIGVLAAATHPTAGPDDGASLALVL